MPAAKLYSTSFCHLCEDAQQTLKQARIAYTIVDILGDDLLFEQYGTRIPVLKRTDTNAELDWPFDAVTAVRFIC